MVTADGAARVANDVCDFRYRARQRVVRPGEQEPAAIHPVTETQILIECGRLDMMVGGAVATLAAGDFVRVPAGQVFAWRNDSALPATLLIHTVAPGHVCPSMKVNAPQPDGAP